MFRIDTSTAARNLPDPGPAGKPGYFQDGDPRTGAPATIPDADWFNMVQEELAEVCTHYGVALDKADRTQVRQAIEAAIAGQRLGMAAFRDIGTAAGNAPEVLRATGKLDPSIIPATPADLFRKRLLLNALLDAMAGGAARRILDAVADPFADTGKIDAEASRNYTHDGAGGFVHNPPAAAGYGPNLITGAETYAASGQTSRPGQWGPEQVADGDLKTEWFSPNGVSHWWRVQFGEPVTVRQCRIYDARQLNNWRVLTFEGSNDGADWTRVDHVSGLNFKKTQGWIERAFSNPAAYAHYRIAITMKNAASNAHISAVEMFEALPPRPAPHMTLVSTAFEAFAEPAAGYLMGVVEPVDAVAYGEDVLADLSRDDGKTWEALTLAKAGVTEDGHDVVFGEVRFAAAAAGRSVRSRWRTRNNKHVKLHGAILDAEG